MILTIRADNRVQATAVKSACLMHSIECDEYHEPGDADWAFDLVGPLDKIEMIAAKTGAIIVDYSDRIPR
jgi:hypothetical protein